MKLLQIPRQENIWELVLGGTGHHNWDIRAALYRKLSIQNINQIRWMLDGTREANQNQSLGASARRD